MEEPASGTDAQRPQRQAWLDDVREGDTRVITRLDRFARSPLPLGEMAALLARKGVHLQVLDQQVDTHTPTGRMLFGMLSVIAQFETELRAERQREGITKAKRAGVHFGRTKALTPAQAEELMQRYRVGKTAVYRYLAQGGHSTSSEHSLPSKRAPGPRGDGRAKSACLRAGDMR